MPGNLKCGVLELKTIKTEYDNELKATLKLGVNTVRVKLRKSLPFSVGVYDLEIISAMTKDVAGFVKLTEGLSDG